MTTPRLRGRAAQPLRPGFVIKSVLSGNIPLTTGELVKEAAITDIHSVYRYLTKQENIVRSRDKRLRGMTYRSFITLFKFAHLLRLVERVREEPMLFPPPGGPLLSIRKPDGAHIVEAKRVIYKLTSVGGEDELAWSNLCKAWIEHWPVPQKGIEVVVPGPPITKAPPILEEVPVVPPAELKIPKLAKTPSVAQFRKLLVYLKAIRDAGISGMALTNRLDAISGQAGDWDIYIGDSLEDAREAGQKAKIAKLTTWNKAIKEAVEGFLDEDLQKIISSLEELT